MPVNTKEKRADLAKAIFSCPVCGTENSRIDKRPRTCHDVDGVTWKLTVGVYYCKRCCKHYRSHNVLFPKSKHFTIRVIDFALAEYSTGITYEQASIAMRTKYKVNVPPNTIAEWIYNDDENHTKALLERRQSEKAKRKKTKQVEKAD